MIFIFRSLYFLFVVERFLLETSLILRGAVVISQTKFLIIESMIFQDCFSNYYAGALAIEQATSAKIISSQFSNNGAEESGGAIYLFNSNLFIQNCSFYNNSALRGHGGAIYLILSALNIQDSQFLENKAAIGGAIAYDGKKSQIERTNNTFSQNFADFYGNQFGSHPQYLQISDNNNFQEQKSINVSGIKPGGFFEERLSIQFYDEEKQAIRFNMLKFDKKYSLSIINEMKSYHLMIESKFNQDLLIDEGKLLILDELESTFKLNLSARYRFSKIQKTQLHFLTPDSQLELDLILEFRKCQIGEISVEDFHFVQCKECAYNSYSFMDPELGDIVNCKPCPQSALSCQKDSIILKDGYWRFSKFSEEIYECASLGCSEQNQNINGCLPGYTGIFCQACDSTGEVWENRYSKSNKKCLLCSDQLSQITFIIFFIFGYSLYIGYNVYSVASNKIILIKLNYLTQMGLLFSSASKHTKEILGSLLKIVISHLQLASLLLSFGDLFSDDISLILNLLGNQIEASKKSIDCLIVPTENFPSWVSRIIIFLMIILVQFLIFYCCCLIVIKKYKNKQNQLLKPQSQSGTKSDPENKQIDIIIQKKQNSINYQGNLMAESFILKQKGIQQQKEVLNSLALSTSNKYLSPHQNNMFSIPTFSIHQNSFMTIPDENISNIESKFFQKSHPFSSRKGTKLNKPEGDNEDIEMMEADFSKIINYFSQPSYKIKCENQEQKITENQEYDDASRQDKLLQISVDQEEARLIKKRSSYSYSKIYNYILTLSAIIGFFFYFPSFTKLLIEAILLIKVGDQTVLQADFSKQAFTKVHLVYSFLLIYPTFIIWVIAIPFILLKSTRSALEQKENIKIKFLIAYSFFIQGFKRERYYWEIVRMLYKIILMFFLASQIQATLKSVLISGVVLGYFSVLQQFKPFTTYRLHQCETVNTLCLLYSLILQMIIQSFGQMPLTIGKLLSSGILILITFGLFYSGIKFLQVIVFENDSAFLKYFKKCIFYKLFTNIIRSRSVRLRRIHKLWKIIYVFSKQNKMMKK